MVCYVAELIYIAHFNILIFMNLGCLSRGLFNSKAAGTKCKMDSTCFSVYADDDLLLPDATVESSHLFTRVQRLEIDSICLAAHHNSET